MWKLVAYLFLPTCLHYTHISYKLFKNFKNKLIKPVYFAIIEQNPPQKHHITTSNVVSFELSLALCCFSRACCVNTTR